MHEAVAVLIPACAIGLLLFPVWPTVKTHGAAAVRTAVAVATLALCLGIGFSSLASTALIVVGIAPATSGFLLADATLWASVGALGWWLRRRSQEPRAESSEPRAESREDRTDRILPVLFGMTAIAALTSVALFTRASPHGEWDAWAIWNQHARFLFRGGGSNAWQGMFMVEWSQPDYPWLLPASVARVWAYAGHESTLGPALIAVILGMASVVLVITALDGRRRWVAGALMLGANTFLTQVASQCADVPLACYIVATLAVACGDVLRLGQTNRRAHAMTVGATTAMAGWTKNEGVVFAVLMLIAAVAVAVRGPADAGRSVRPAEARRSRRHREVRQLWWGIVGASPVVIALVWFKLALAPPSVLVDGLSLTVFTTRLLDLDRHLTVATLMAHYVISWSGRRALAILPLMGLTAVWRAGRSVQVRVMVAVVGLMLLSYYLIYVITPFDISWHISTSIDRLLVQLWPSLVLAAFWTGRSIQKA